MRCCGSCSAAVFPRVDGSDQPVAVAQHCFLGLKALGNGSVQLINPRLMVDVVIPINVRSR